MIPRIYRLAAALGALLLATTPLAPRAQGFEPDLGQAKEIIAGREMGKTAIPPNAQELTVYPIDPSGSVFVVFRAVAEPARVTSVALDGKAALATAWDKAAPKRSAAAPENNRNVTGTFTMTAWVKPEAEIALPREAKSGPSGTGYAQNSVVYPAPGHEVYAAPGQVYATEHSCAGFSVGTNGVAIYEHGD